MVQLNFQTKISVVVTHNLNKTKHSKKKEHAFFFPLSRRGLNTTTVDGVSMKQNGHNNM